MIKVHPKTFLSDVENSKIETCTISMLDSPQLFWPLFFKTVGVPNPQDPDTLATRRSLVSSSVPFPGFPAHFPVSLLTAKHDILAGI
jgi:hypothetical protein